MLIIVNCLPQRLFHSRVVFALASYFGKAFATGSLNELLRVRN